MDRPQQLHHTDTTYRKKKKPQFSVKMAVWSLRDRKALEETEEATVKLQWSGGEGNGLV